MHLCANFFNVLWVEVRGVHNYSSLRKSRGRVVHVVLRMEL